MRKTLVLLFALTLALTAAALAEVTLTDMTGRTVTLPDAANRIVALSPSDCEILYAIGAGEMLVGRGAYCDYPEQVLQVPSVNSGEQTNLETIIALSPQVVLMTKMAQTTEQIQTLEAAGIRVVVSDADDIPGTYQAIEMIGTLVNREAEAAQLIDDMTKAFAAIQPAAETAGMTVYFEVSPLKWGLWTAGNNTFMEEIASMIGLRNIFHEVDGWAEISQEQVIARDPDFIITTAMYSDEGLPPEDEVLAREGWQGMKAIEGKRVLNVDSNAITRPGPRLVQGAQELYDFVMSHLK